MKLLKDNGKRIGYLLLLIVLPAIPIFIMSNTMDFIKGPISIVFVVLYSLMSSSSISDKMEVAIIVLFYMIMIYAGIKYYKRNTLIAIFVFSSFNSLLALYIILMIGG